MYFCLSQTKLNISSPVTGPAYFYLAENSETEDESKDSLDDELNDSSQDSYIDSEEDEF